MNHSKTF